MKFLKLVVFFLVSTVIYSIVEIPVFGPRESKGELDNNEISEASGITESKTNPGILWVHNDSGNKSKIYGIDTNGVTKVVITLNGITNRDWEDIAVGPGLKDGKSYIFIGDIGDNAAKYDLKYIYIIEEPELNLDSSVENITIDNEKISKVTFKYPDGARDSETLLVDPISKNIYTVSKRDSNVRVYKIEFPYSLSKTITSEISCNLKLPVYPKPNFYPNQLTAGDISADGSGILIKSYLSVFYWKRDTSKSLCEAFSSEPDIVEYTVEPQGEAICWFGNNGYFTLSEERNNIPAILYYYPKQNPNGIDNKIDRKSFNLKQNYPNPFNPGTTIEYTISAQERETQKTLLKIFDITGQEIATIVDELKFPGSYKENISFNNLASGIYFYSLSIGNLNKTKKMLLLR
ncbi:MAG: hypothetical protein CR986_07725 [Ignavibacteriae bacterium]|nr:MAG: hypothetical protein CR986_07725 [Ignavibacteriota bacterium]